MEKEALGAQIDPLTLSQLLASYLCHEMASPVSTFLTGLDILNSSDSDDEVMQLLKKSAQNLKSALTLFRAAYGFGGSDLTLRKARSLCMEALQNHANIKLHWPEMHPSEHPTAGMGQLTLNLALWICGKAPQGGRLDISYGPDKWPLFTLTSPMIMTCSQEELSESCHSSLEAQKSSDIPAYISSILLKSLNKTVSLIQNAVMLQLYLQDSH